MLPFPAFPHLSLFSSVLCLNNILDVRLVTGCGETRQQALHHGKLSWSHQCGLQKIIELFEKHLYDMQESHLHVQESWEGVCCPWHNLGFSVAKYEKWVNLVLCNYHEKCVTSSLFKTHPYKCIFKCSCKCAMDCMTHMFHCYATTQDEAIIKIWRLTWFFGVHSYQREVVPELL